MGCLDVEGVVVAVNGREQAAGDLGDRRAYCAGSPYSSADRVRARRATGGDGGGQPATANGADPCGFISRIWSTASGWSGSTLSESGGPKLACCMAGCGRVFFQCPMCVGA